MTTKHEQQSDDSDSFAGVELITTMKALGFELSHHEGIADWLTKDEGTSELTVFGAQDLVAELSAIVAEIIGEDRHHEEEYSSRVTKMQQRQRARAKGLNV